MVQKLGLGSVGGFAIKRVFRKIDKNKNGELDSSEVSAAIDIIKGLIGKAVKQNETS